MTNCLLPQLAFHRMESAGAERHRREAREVSEWRERIKRSTIFRMENAFTEKPHVIIVGAGFGGLEAAKHFACENVRVTVIDRTNYHLFQPLLCQVATAALSPADIAAPVRAVLSKCRNVEVDRKSTRLNSSHANISYAVFCLKKKKKK